MAYRVTEEEVLEIIDTSVNLAPFMKMANIFVTAQLGSSGLDTETLAEIERNLVAHFLSAKDPRTKSEKVDVLSESFTHVYGLGLNGTAYGQTAILMDSTGTLSGIAQYGLKKSASVSTFDLHTDYGSSS